MEGDPALWFCLVNTGHVRIFRQSRGGKDVVLETVETTIRIVSRWLKDRLVREEENRLVLADVATLRDLAEGESD